ncbi:hypothetical protein Hdeb2414_s0019g00540831 [Helianthus debilis subsp. tardiflorus]
MSTALSPVLGKLIGNLKILRTHFLESPYWCPKSSWVAFDFPCSSCTKCKQCKIRAVKVKDDLESVISGINVLVNPEKPRRGCFEVREEGGKKFVSLLDMKRPFGPMKAWTWRLS